ncbi:MAG: hypothetical protein K0Q73_4583 [Paenibacillus sp.]|jgi:hypothetical protein|nr:hypothetical protein [Paenibacillus sp.]
MPMRRWLEKVSGIYLRTTSEKTELTEYDSSNIFSDNEGGRQMLRPFCYVMKRLFQQELEHGGLIRDQGVVE